MIRIIYEDNHLLVVEKPVNIPVQEDDSKDRDLLNILKDDLKIRYNKPGNVYLGLVHRLDRPVGGIMVFAKTSKAAARLSKQISGRDFRKKYLAVVEGSMENQQGSWQNYLLKDPRTNTVRTTTADKGKEALLDYSCLASHEGLSLLEIALHTGRSHQIRVQCAAHGHPIWGDQRYNPAAVTGQQIALWAYELSFAHPTTRETLTLTCLPEDRQPWTQFDLRKECS